MHRNPLIDGWRGVCVLLVIVDHLISYRFVEYFELTPFRTILAAEPFNVLDLIKNIALRFPYPLADAALNIFLALSGYLIASLALKDEATGSFSIGAFYLRRIFRILPTFYVFFFVSFFFAVIGLLPITAANFISAGAFICNTSLGDCGWWFGHTFSLNIQEQFYILFPLAFCFLGPFLRTRFLAVLFLSLLFLSWSEIGSNASYFASIVAGVLYGCSTRVARLVNRLATSSLIILSILLILMQPFLASISIAFNIINLFKPALVCFILLGTLRGVGPLSRVVSQVWLQKIGTISYSLYLWQQIFTAGPQYGGNPILNNPLWIFPCALISYALVERPMMKSGQRLSNLLVGRLKSQATALPVQ